MINLPCLIDNVLFIDNSMIEDVTTCPRLTYYKHFLKRELAGGRPPLRFGKIIHDVAMTYRFRNEFYGKTWTQMELNDELAKAFAADPCEDEGWRNLDTAVKVSTEYNELCQNEGCETVSINGKPMIEMSFAYPAGVVDGITIMYCGRIDRVVRYTIEGVFVRDYKTTSRLGDTFWQANGMSGQGRGYCWAVKQCLGEEPLGFEIQALAARAPTEKGKGKSVEIPYPPTRFYTKEPPGQLDEWRENLLEQCSIFLFYAKNNHFPMHQKHCIGKYGACQYLRVCELPTSQRLTALSSDAFTDVTWSPLNQEQNNAK